MERVDGNYQTCAQDLYLTYEISHERRFAKSACVIQSKYSLRLLYVQRSAPGTRSNNKFETYLSHL